LKLRIGHHPLLIHQIEIVFVAGKVDYQKISINVTLFMNENF